MEAGLDEAVGVAVEAGVELLAGEVADDVLGQDLGLEVRDRAGLEVGRSVASPIAKMFGFAFVCSVCLSVGTKPSSSPSPGERSTYAAPPCSGTVTSRSKSTLAAVERDQLAAGAVDLAGVELGHELDLLLVEQEGTGKRAERDVDNYSAE